jgi:U3 small nucleolar RNA-associated protein 10
MRRIVNIHIIFRFFSHLIDVMGPDDFLPPICMLLIDKVVNRVIRQSPIELQGSLALPISILQHYSSIAQILVRLPRILFWHR